MNGLLEKGINRVWQNAGKFRGIISEVMYDGTHIVIGQFRGNRVMA